MELESRSDQHLGAVRRRSLTTAGAWALPVIVGAAAAPLAAASQQPVLDYDFAGISATGEPGATLTAAKNGPGARIRDRHTGAPVAGQTIVFAYVSGPFTLKTFSGVTDSTGAARATVVFDADAPRGILGAIRATWVGLDGNTYSADFDVSVND